jgi:hypothetical protein
MSYTTERESLELRKDVLVFRFHLGMPFSHHVGDRVSFSSQTLSAEKHRGGNWFLKRVEQTHVEEISHGEPTARSDRLASCGVWCGL